MGGLEPERSHSLRKIFGGHSRTRQAHRSRARVRHREICPRFVAGKSRNGCSNLQVSSRERQMRGCFDTKLRMGADLLLYTTAPGVGHSATISGLSTSPRTRAAGVRLRRWPCSMDLLAVSLGDSTWLRD